MSLSWHIREQTLYFPGDKLLESTSLRAGESSRLYPAACIHQWESSDKLYFRVFRVEGHAAYHQDEKFLFLLESSQITSCEWCCNCLPWNKGTTQGVKWLRRAPSSTSRTENLLSRNQWKWLHQHLSFKQKMFSFVALTEIIFVWIFPFFPPKFQAICSVSSRDESQGWVAPCRVLCTICFC